MQQPLSRARHALTTAEADSAWSQGQSMTLAQAVEEALHERDALLSAERAASRPPATPD
jgi:hypothetical protein